MARPVRGKVLVRRPGSNEFVELDGSQSIPMGSTVDAKKGRVRITAETQQGKAPQRAEFYDGIFRITQTSTLVDLRLVEALDCSSRRSASAAQRKPKKRKLWGSGKGKFRTTGSYSAATVRGTTWLVRGHVHDHAHARDRGRRGGARQAAAKDDPGPQGQALRGARAALRLLTNRTLLEALISG